MASLGVSFWRPRVYALVSFFVLDSALLRLVAGGAVLGLFAASGESSSKLGPPDGVLDPVREGEYMGESFREDFWRGETILARSMGLNASDADRPETGSSAACFTLKSDD